MRTIGLIGGMSCESTVVYYQLINQEIKRRLGGHHNGRSVLVTVDFHDIERMQREGAWDEMGTCLADAARQLEQAAAEFVVLCTNTMHKVAPAIESATRLPFLHIADATAAALRTADQTRAGLLGTRFTMEQPFLRERLERAGIEVLVPEAAERELIHRVIFEELVHGELRAESRGRYVEIIEGLARRGAQSVILGCTEIGLLVSPADASIPLYDTARIHALAAVEMALG